jgi:S-adenosylmethionine synthetase
MVGYATNETKELLPLEVILSRRLNQYLYKKWPFDGKTQVTIKNGEIIALVTSFQHAPQDELLARVKHWLRQDKDVKYTKIDFHINPAGDWQVGGFEADAGLTGRKLVVDNYGPRIPIGGGCFSGKDASKVDRSAAYIARKVAVDYLRDRQASEVFVHLAYAIGYAQPLEATVTIDGQQEKIKGYDLTPDGIIKALQLLEPQYEQTARYGHFGHADFAWEQ